MGGTTLKADPWEDPQAPRGERFPALVQNT